MVSSSSRKSKDFEVLEDLKHTDDFTGFLLVFPLAGSSTPSF
jgi:hypothetical protein